MSGSYAASAARIDNEFSSLARRGSTLDPRIAARRLELERRRAHLAARREGLLRVVACAARVAHAIARMPVAEQRSGAVRLAYERIRTQSLGGLRQKADKQAGAAQLHCVDSMLR